MERSSLFTAQEFIDKLRRNGVSAPLKLAGMVKLPEDDSPELMFAPGTHCADWITVPLDAIASVEVLDTVPCHDHTHPLVILTFKEPESSEGTMFAALLSATTKRQAVSRPLQRFTTGADPTRVRVRRAKLSSDVILGPETPVAGGCAAGCNDYEIFEDGVIRPLVSCKDYGGGIYVCYYE
jgi:hypothetical protein